MEVTITTDKNQIDLTKKELVILEEVFKKGMDGYKKEFNDGARDKEVDKLLRSFKNPSYK